MAPFVAEKTMELTRSILRQITDGCKFCICFCFPNAIGRNDLAEELLTFRVGWIPVILWGEQMFWRTKSVADFTILMTQFVQRIYFNFEFTRVFFLIFLNYWVYGRCVAFVRGSVCVRSKMVITLTGRIKIGAHFFCEACNNVYHRTCYELHCATNQMFAWTNFHRNNFESMNIWLKHLYSLHLLWRLNLHIFVVMSFKLNSFRTVLLIITCRSLST